MKNFKKSGFTLIELLAVIIILAVIALIATPIILNVVDNAKESARQSSIAGYADATKLAVYDHMFGHNGQIPDMNQGFIDSIKPQGDTVTCNDIIYSETYGVVLNQCHVGKVEDKKYCFASGKTYIDCNDTTFQDIYNKANDGNDNSYTDASGANKPELTDKLIPVIYEDNTWKVADKTQKWYDYDKQEWANAVILNNGVTKTTGQTLDLTSDVAMMYVWIPRYEYKLPTGANGVGTTGTPDPINIQFIDSSKTTATAGYSIHPGFTFDGKNKKGIWIGKFETTTTDTTCLGTASEANCNKIQGIKVLPNTDSLRYINVSNMFHSSRQAQTDYNLTGLDIHMSKYTEQTAVNYLTYSKYGRCNGDTCTEVTINNYSLNSNGLHSLTGCAGASVSATNVTTCSYTYEKSEGQLASTTGNITGVYDISGGAYEYVMGYLTNANTNYASNTDTYFGWTASTNYAGFTSKPNDKYFDNFVSSNINVYSYSVLQAVNGKTIFSGIISETMSDKTKYSTWFNDYADFMEGTYPWLVLGGNWGCNTDAGLFYSNRNDGRASGSSSFRVVLSIEK